MKHKNTTRGASLLLLLFGLAFLIIAGRFLYIQTTGTVQGVDLEEWADKKRTSSYTIPAERGKIYDKNGMVLAYDRPTYRLQAIVEPEYSENLPEPEHVTDPEEVAAVLSDYLPLEKSDITNRIEEGQEEGRFQVEFGSAGRDIPKDDKEDIESSLEEKEITGVTFEEETERFYPNGTFASHILGFAQSTDEGVEGVTGVEKSMENYLEGEDGSISYQRDKYGTELLDPEEILKAPKDGEDVYLTIDQKIQTFLEDALTQVEKEYDPAKVMAGVMDPETGEILAMGNRPAYNPNDRSDVENWYNDMIAYPFEVGSTMKMFTWAAAMEEGVYNPSETFQSGSYTVGGSTISDHNDSGWGTITYDKGLMRSSNVAAAKLGYEKLGPETFRDYIGRFGLDDKTGIDLPGEKTGTILSGAIETVTTSYGQGSTMTPIQLLTAATSIANEGKMMKPYVFDSIREADTGEAVAENETETLGEPISKQTAEQMKELLTQVVSNEDGTGKPFALEDFSVAGKTGTANISEGGYLAGRNNYTFSFLGMAPAEDPELVMYVAVRQPKLENSEIGSDPVSHIFKTVMQNSLHYLNISPDQNEKMTVENLEIPEVEGESVEEAKQSLSEFSEVTVVGSGSKVEAVLPHNQEEAVANEHIMIITDEPTMPNITGWSQREVQRLADYFGITLEVMGNGYVKKQSIERSAALDKDDYLVIELEPPETP
ncbi:penicillin-binding transpeptidase domain-containing protein [Salimicrobium halophilum]|uniref:serine-type D-Ala-D-Ala carboxypeptidase n=1 Tax=Salimicrobium halophilum TaxID=86666 RepID=A0A1G8QFV1_9BACI|nr:penicillin-binding transpeptidase domain-containing protein [Salimicrobium halophilum]SDJ03669.1 penicillin-binding protein 2B [Salimicrobium halophilum]